MIPFYTQVQNCPFSSWQSKIFEIYPKNSKVVLPIFRPFLLYIPPDGFPTRNQRNVCAAARSALQDTGRQRRINAARHMLFHTGASARRNNAAFHGMFRIGRMFLRPLLFSLSYFSIPGRLWQGQTGHIRFHDGQRPGTPEFLPVTESEESPLCLPGQTLARPARPYLNPSSFTYLLYTSCLSPYTVSRVPLSAWQCRPDLSDAKVCHRVLIVRTEIYFLQILPLCRA